MTAGPEAFFERYDVSRETIVRLEKLEAVLRKWNPAINLVSPQTLDQIWTRHFLDSAQLLDIIPQPPQHWADLGSGGGFPGLVVCLLAAEKFPQMKTTLVESDKRKAAFLLTALRELGLKAEVLAARIEALPPLGADVLSARALAPLEQLLSFAERHLGPEGIAVFPKGNRWREEVALAQKTWSFSYEPKPSATDPDSVVLIIKGLQRV